MTAARGFLPLFGVLVGAASAGVPEYPAAKSSSLPLHGRKGATLPKVSPAPFACPSGQARGTEKPPTQRGRVVARLGGHLGREGVEP